jgi:hypothetical protein
MWMDGWMLYSVAKKKKKKKKKKVEKHMSRLYFIHSTWISYILNLKVIPFDENDLFLLFYAMTGFKLIYIF